MHNLDTSTAMAAAASNNSATPRTPEIVNSLIAMTNPLDFMCGGDNNGINYGATSMKRFYANSASSDSNSSSSSQESRTGGGHHIRINAFPPTPAPSIQQTCSQLIKAGLKLSIEQKRKLQSDNEDLVDLNKIKRIKRNESESEEDKQSSILGLTPEDEERRRRRRERNKIAATKCRLKKRERTANLIQEAEVLESSNVEFKAQFSALKTEKLRLEEILRQHKLSCSKEQDSAYNRLPPMHSIETTSNHHSYSRPPTSTVDTNDSCYHHQQANQLDFDSTQMYNTLQYKTPSIIVESVNDDDYPSLTDLDNPNDTSYGYNYGQNQNYSLDGCMA